MTAGSLGEMPTTRARRLISLLTRPEDRASDMLRRSTRALSRSISANAAGPVSGGTSARNVSAHSVSRGALHCRKSGIGYVGRPERTGGRCCRTTTADLDGYGKTARLVPDHQRRAGPPDPERGYLAGLVLLDRLPDARRHGCAGLAVAILRTPLLRRHTLEDRVGPYL